MGVRGFGLRASGVLGLRGLGFGDLGIYLEALLT